LTSGSGVIFLDIVSRTAPGKEYGALYASNYNGTKFSLSLQGTNRNGDGLVDIERLSAVKGVLLANRVSNTEQLVGPNAKKQLSTQISYNDGK
jgi:hypothetical protein